ncbi:hypothetical protein CCACVL1_26001 [Corchorus capsularis]|uniref:Uncharacterized protein n=1 Tax=Corchorus capsularis TaxID=210143 RepID=A0A1R3GG77_COCAP|nr:hypothetical protein CCACVL1_26001 [Corchorus capsularis]
MGSLEEEELVQMEILRSGTETEKEIVENVLKHIGSKRDVPKTSGLKKWLAMRLKMNGFNASLCQTSWVTSLGCPGGDYEYIEILLENQNTGEPMRLIVDIDFKSQFELARPTPTYKELTDSLPIIFVGTEEKLNKIISVLCSAAKQSFREAGLHVPPWRTSSYMQSKWLSDCRHNNKVAANSGFSRGNNKEAKAKANNGAHSFSKWAPPLVIKPGMRKNLGGGGSALSSQFSNMGINCC